MSATENRSRRTAHEIIEKARCAGYTQRSASTGENSGRRLASRLAAQDKSNAATSAGTRPRQEVVLMTSCS